MSKRLFPSILRQKTSPLQPKPAATSTVATGREARAATALNAERRTMALSAVRGAIVRAVKGIEARVAVGGDVVACAVRPRPIPTSLP